MESKIYYGNIIFILLSKPIIRDISLKQVDPRN